MREVVFHCGGSSPHLSHIMSGFALLRAAGEVSVRFRRTDGYEPGAKADATISVVVDGRHRLVFELRDGSDLAVAELDWSSFYFKRSYLRVDHGGDPRIVPLGLNYPVTASGDWRLRRALYSLLATRRGSFAAGVSTAVGLGGPSGLSKRLGVEPWSASKVDLFEDEGGGLDPPNVLLLTRVWDHRKMSGAKAEHWERLNGLRAACIRALSLEFGPQFVGGLAPTPSALRDFPDLVVDASTTRRSVYLGTMKSSRVCVATAGLRDSNGFRLAEYTAASRAIVSEHLSFEVPGPFGAGTHYLPFRSADQCVEACRRLVDDREACASMMAANRSYYLGYVRPDALVRNALSVLPE